MLLPHSILTHNINCIFQQWDDGLAGTATKLANKCKIEHDKPEERATEKFPKVGQNLAGNPNVAK